MWRRVMLCCLLAGCEGGKVASERVAVAPPAPPAPAPPVGRMQPAKLPNATGGVAAWTGSELLVWGGRSGEWEESWSGHDRTVYPKPALTNAGHRYDPGSDTLTPMATKGAPEAREGAVGVWTPKGLFIWGGAKEKTVGAEVVLAASLGTGALYDPTSDRWTPTAAPPGEHVNGRMWHSAAWTGSEVLIWGGVQIGPDVIDGDRVPHRAVTGGLAYDPLQDRWRVMSNAQAPRADRNQLTAWTGTELIVIGDPPRFAAAYNPARDAWRALRPPPEAMFVSPSAPHVVIDGKLVVLGVIDPNGINAIGLYRLDPVPGTWSEHALDIPVCGVEGAAVYTGTYMLAFSSTSSGCVIDPRHRLARAIGSNNNRDNTGPEHAVWTGDRAIVWGGTYMGRPPPNEGMYRPARAGTIGGARYAP